VGHQPLGTSYWAGGLDYWHRHPERLVGPLFFTETDLPTDRLTEICW